MAFKQFDDALCQCQDRYLCCPTNVEHIAHRGVCLGQSHERAHRVLDVAETARLRAIAINLDRLTGQGRADKAWHDHAIAARLPRADRVEQPDQRDRQAILVVVGQTEKLVDHFGGRIRPAAAARRAQEHVVLLAKRDLRSLAVDLGRRRDQRLGSVPACGLEDCLCAADVGGDRLYR